jgi:hypothetical protein
MLRDLKHEAAKYGLKLHFGKTEIFTNNFHAAKSGSVEIDGVMVKIAQPGETAKYLGRKLSMLDFHGVEVDHRVDAGWAVFGKFRSEFCGRYVCLRTKIRLFEAIVTLTVLYGCCAWTMTKELEAQLQCARRRMLRLLFPWSRKRHTNESGAEELEPWVEWIQTVTRKIEKYMASLHIEDWVTLQRRQKFRFAGKLARCTDQRWARILLAWQPSREFGRRIRRPVRRWDDDIVLLVGGGWQSRASDLSFWKLLEEVYARRTDAC